MKTLNFSYLNSKKHNLNKSFSMMRIPTTMTNPLPLRLRPIQFMITLYMTSIRLASITNQNSIPFLHTTTSITNPIKKLCLLWLVLHLHLLNFKSLSSVVVVGHIEATKWTFCAIVEPLLYAL